MLSEGISVDSTAELSLTLGRETLRRQPLTYNRSGVPAQYQLTLSFEYFVTKNNAVLIEQESITARRNYDFDPNLIIAKDREEQELLEEMQRELSSRILSNIRRRL